MGDLGSNATYIFSGDIIQFKTNYLSSVLCPRNFVKGKLGIQDQAGTTRHSSGSGPPTGKKILSMDLSRRLISGKAKV